MTNKRDHSLSEYQAFRALMEGGTTIAAAQRLGLSQSAISRAIANLESRGEWVLFAREAGRLVPTEEAVRLNRRLDPLFDALSRLSGPTEPVQETLRLIVPPSFAHRYVVSLINSFLRTHPHFFVSLEVNTSDEVVRGLMEDRFDLGMIGVEISRAGVQMLRFRSTSVACVMAPGHPLGERSEIWPGDLDGERLIALTHRHGRRAQLDSLLHRAGVQAQIVAEVSTSYAAIDLAREGLGVAVVNPFPALHYRSGDVEFRKFNSEIRYFSYFAVSDRRPLPRIARAFMRHVRLMTPGDMFSEKG